MTPEERQMLAGLFERIGATAATPRDPAAEAFIAEAVRALPHAPYVLAQTVLVQQQALENASRRLAELEAQARAQAAPPEETSFLGGLGRSLFGGGQPATPPRPNIDPGAGSRPYAPDPAYQRQPAYAPPPPQSGPWGAPPPAAAPPMGGGFMQSALTTAAGVAGGLFVAHELGNLFGGHSAGLGLGSLGGGETVNNFFDSAPAATGRHEQDFVPDGDQNRDDVQDVSYDDSAGGGDDGSYDT